MSILAPGATINVINPGSGSPFGQNGLGANSPFGGSNLGGLQGGGKQQEVARIEKKIARLLEKLAGLEGGGNSSGSQGCGCSGSGDGDGDGDGGGGINPLGSIGSSGRYGGFGGGFSPLSSLGAGLPGAGNGGSAFSFADQAFSSQLSLGSSGTSGIFG